MKALALAVLEDNYPGLCINMGLTCEACTAEAARNLAKTCKGLRGPAVRQLFVQIYPDPACCSMVPHFEQSYKEATAGRQTASVTKIKTAAFQNEKALASVA